MNGGSLAGEGERSVDPKELAKLSEERVKWATKLHFVVGGDVGDSDRIPATAATAKEVVVEISRARLGAAAAACLTAWCLSVCLQSRAELLVQFNWQQWAPHHRMLLLMPISEPESAAMSVCLCVTVHCRRRRCRCPLPSLCSSNALFSGLRCFGSLSFSLLLFRWLCVSHRRSAC